MAKKKINKLNKLSEPPVAYRSNRIKTFASFEEQEKFNYEEVLKQKPLDRIRETVKLILRVYGFTRKSLKERKLDNRIYFD